MPSQHHDQQTSYNLTTKQSHLIRNKNMEKTHEYFNEATCFFENYHRCDLELLLLQVSEQEKSFRIIILNSFITSRMNRSFLTLSPKVRTSPSLRWTSAFASLAFAMTVLQPMSPFKNPLPVIWSACTWVLTAIKELDSQPDNMISSPKEVSYLTV